MKKILLALFVVMTNMAMAQISITQSDFKTNNYTYVTSLDTTPTISVGSGGSGQTWDFTSLNAHTTETNTLSDGSTVQAFYPGCNMLMTSSSGDSNYFMVTNDGFYNMFNMADFGINKIQKLKAITFPCKLTDVTKDSVAYSMVSTDTVFGVYDSLRLSLSFKSMTTADGEGNLKLPVGNFDVIRLSVEFEIVINIEVKSSFLTGGQWAASPFNFPPTTGTSYMYMGNNNGYPLATVSNDDKGKPSSVDYRTWTTGVKSFENSNQFSVYPNPASNNVAISNLASNSKIRVMDLSGKTWLSENNISGNINLNVSELPAGLYLIECTLVSGQVQHQKLMVK